LEIDLTTKVSTIDVLQMFDLDLSRKGPIKDLFPLLPAQESDAFRRCRESFRWVFESQTVPGGPVKRALDPTRRYYATDVNCPDSWPNFDRFALAPDPDDGLDRGGYLSISGSLQAGVLCLWRSYPPTANILDVKLGLSVDISQHYLDQINGLFPYIEGGQLMYPFIGLLYQSSNLDEIMQQDGLALGYLLAGGLDHEPDDLMRKYVSQNLSHRRYEGLFIQSSSALGVYTKGIEKTPEEDVALYERTLFRAVQICELCLIEQRLLLTFRSKVDEDAAKVQIIPRPLLVERHREALLELENRMVKALPFRSSEAGPLLRKAQAIFEIPTFLRDAKDSYDFLEKRYQNTKTTLFAALAVVTYILEKLKFWDSLPSLWHLLKTSVDRGRLW
jgi:hypothetical protein